MNDSRAERLLRAFPPSALDDVPAGVRALLVHDELVLTLETYLDQAGDVTRTSAALGLHRARLHDRLRRIEAPSK